MTREQIFEIWAPPYGRWSPWVKPVLFACMVQQPWIDPAQSARTVDLRFIPHASENAALVFDLPGADGVWAGIAAAAQGYRPVPLYNALPGPVPSRFFVVYSTTAMVDVDPIVAALWHGTTLLQRAILPLDAPPVFLLDSRRRGEGVTASPGRFDNRSVSFTTDFPSAIFLASHGIRRVVLVQATGDRPQADLAHTLRRWQDAGISIELVRLDLMGAPVPIQVQKPSGFRFFWHRTLALLGLRRHGLGGFGGVVPEPSSG